MSGSGYALLALHSAFARPSPTQSAAAASSSGTSEHGAAGQTAGAAGAAAAAAGSTPDAAMDTALQVLGQRARSRASQFGAYAAQHWQDLYETPDHPASLYEVRVMLACTLTHRVASLRLTRY